MFFFQGYFWISFEYVVTHVHSSDLHDFCWIFLNICSTVVRKVVPMYVHTSRTVESPNKGHFGWASLSFVRRLPSLGDSKCTRTIGRKYFWTSCRVLCRVSLFGASSAGQFTVCQLYLSNHSNCLVSHCTEANDNCISWNWGCEISGQQLEQYNSALHLNTNNTMYSCGWTQARGESD